MMTVVNTARRAQEPARPQEQPPRSPASTVRYMPSAVETIRSLPSDPVHSRNTC